MQIMLADANAEVLAALRLILEQRVIGEIAAGEVQGHQVIGEARDAISLFAHLARCANGRCCPEVILLDTSLPGVFERRLSRKSAIKVNSKDISPLAELVEALRLICPTVRVIALSSRPTEEKESMQAGADGFVCKSDPPDGLLALLESISLITR